MQNSLCIQVLHSHILAALLHGTRAVGMSQILRHSTRNGIKELLYRALPILGRTAIMLGIDPHSSLFCYCWVMCMVINATQEITVSYHKHVQCSQKVDTMNCSYRVRHIISEHELTFTFAICCHPSACRLSVCNARARYSGGSNFLQFFYSVWYMPSIDTHRNFYGDRPRETPPLEELNPRGVA